MRPLLLCLPALLLAVPASAQTPPASPASAEAAPEFRARAQELAGILTGKGDYDGYFSAAFRAQVPREKFDQVNAQLIAANGPFVAVRGIEATSPWSGTVTVEYRDALATMRLAVDPAAPHPVTGLLVTGVTAREKTLGEVSKAIEGLRGTSGFVLAKLGNGAPQVLDQHNADRAFAIGSEFKLVILAELVRATNAGERGWDDPVTLDGVPLPGGGYTSKPAGTKVSLRELATQMISISDNSATDILLRTLGREKVEAMMPVLGIADPARNRPFLGTLELFKLKGVGQGALARRYLALDEAGRRALLAGEIAATPIGAIDQALFKDGKPVLIEQLEWFETPNDLVRVMDWLLRNTEGPKGADARAILSKNPGISPAAAGKWRYVGYKGGSEPGVMAMTLLLQAKNGDWYALSGSWNDPAQEVEQGRFAGLIGRAAELAAPAP